jgi:hypothetical protein
MKKLALGLVIVIPLVLLIGFKSSLFSQKAKAPTSPARHETLASPLSQAEDSDLQKLLSLALLSFKTWEDGYTGCSDANGKDFNLADSIKEEEGKERETRLDVRENSLVVYLDPLRMYLVFPRLHDRGLAPPIDRQFCEKSYEDAVATQKQYPYFERSKKDVRGDPGMTAVVDEINEKYPSPDYDKITREEVRRYQVPLLNANTIEPYAAWTREKRNLYDRVLEVAREEAIFHCKPDKPVRVTIPDFEIGNPNIYVLLEAPATRTTVEWIKFSRDVASGEYIAAPAKNLGLADEVKPLVRLIKREQVKQVSVTCSIQ